MTRLLGILLLPFGVVAAVEAHHSIAAVYDGARQVTIEGVVRKFDFIHPHPVLTVTVAASGAEASWRLEMDNRFELAAIGMTAATLRPGDLVVVTGSPGRTERQSLYIRRLERPADGLEYEQVGMSPRLKEPR